MKALCALALLALAACSGGPKETHASAARAAPVDAGPAAQPSFSTAGLDITWLVGTWERSDQKEWLLFNAPKEVGVIKGKPPTLTKRGEFVPNGRFVSLFFRGVGGVTEERVFEASADRSELRETGATPATYRRGTPP